MTFDRSLHTHAQGKSRQIAALPPHFIEQFIASFASAGLAVLPFVALAAACVSAPQQARAAEAAPVAAAAPLAFAGGSEEMVRAARLKEVDILLMVTALRCRTGPNDFQADFAAFEASHMAEINAATHTLVMEAAARLGPVAGTLSVDRIVTATANRYGNGHPWLDCADLGHLARDFAAEHSDVGLLALTSAALDGGDGAPAGVQLASLHP